jgi:hypothetical protein
MKKTELEFRKKKRKNRKIEIEFSYFSRIPSDVNILAANEIEQRLVISHRNGLERSR